MPINQRPSPEIVRAKLAEVKRRYRRRRKTRTAPQLATLRLNDLNKLFQARYGSTLPDDDSGREDLHVALSHIATLSRARERMARYLDLWAPWMTLGESSQLMTAAFSRQQTWTADQLAWRMRLTLMDRTTLGITTIGAIDLPRTARIKARKLRNKAYAKLWRARRKAANTP